jgi:hypothetical protein
MNAINACAYHSLLGLTKPNVDYGRYFVIVFKFYIGLGLTIYALAFLGA